jgi:enamine deaminase RidA (YjgF/YER057c/UK114 family)
MVCQKYENAQFYSATQVEGAEEHFIILHGEANISFGTTLDQFLTDIKAMETDRQIQKEHLAFSRLYHSDIANQKETFYRSPLMGYLQNGAWSAVEQVPLNSGCASLLLYYIKPKSKWQKRQINVPLDDTSNGILINGQNYHYLLTGNYQHHGHDNSQSQTEPIFQAYTDLLAKHHMNLLDHAVRTWIYVRDVDNHYKGMVDARRTFFLEHGLCPETRYIASTGIEARLCHVDSLVSMDALSIYGLQPEQIERMEALAYMCPTHKYGVTFERGTRLLFGDRSHFYISGTASIDSMGDVLYLSDVEKQTERTIENVNALSSAYDLDINDLAYLIVYVRNIKDAEAVKNVLYQSLRSHIPLLLVHGSVCRPTWLVECEGVAIKKEKNPFPIFE